MEIINKILDLIKPIGKSEDLVKPFEITVDDIKRNHRNRQSEQKLKFHKKYKEASDAELESMLIDMIKRESIDDKSRYARSIYLNDSFADHYLLYMYIEDNINNIQTRLKKSGYRLEFYQAPPENGSNKSVTIYWK
jgi:hypothetical protein